MVLLWALANLNIHTLAPSYHLLSLLSLLRQNFFQHGFEFLWVCECWTLLRFQRVKFSCVCLSPFTANVSHYENARAGAGVCTHKLMWMEVQSEFRG